MFLAQKPGEHEAMKIGACPLFFGAWGSGRTMVRSVIVPCRMGPSFASRAWSRL